MNFVLASLSVFVIVVVVPLPVYILFTKIAGLQEPENPGQFFVSVLVQKLGTTVGFVLLFFLGKDLFTDYWYVYSLIWFAMYAVIEAGQAIGPDYSWKEAFAGIISEAIYFPLAGFAVANILT